MEQRNFENWGFYYLKTDSIYLVKIYCKGVINMTIVDILIVSRWHAIACKKLQYP